VIRSAASRDGLARGGVGRFDVREVVGEPGGLPATVAQSHERVAVDDRTDPLEQRARYRGRNFA
jgi:hypothetical protein